MGLAVAAGYGQPFVPRAEPVISDFNEDPFVFRDQRGHFHALLHGSYCECGTHYFSEDGLYGARFQTEICTRGCHWIPRMFA
jgi:hypothetical protein